MITNIEYHKYFTQTAMRNLFQFFLVLTLWISCLPTCAQTSSDNFVRTRKYLSADGSACQTSISYCDGLGRVVENVQQGATPSGNDLVTLQEYGTLSRVDRTWLPIPHAGNGNFVSPDLFRQYATGAAIYGGDTAPYTETIYETSSLERANRHFGSGQSWKGAQKAIVIERFTNQTSGVLACRKYELSEERSVILEGLFPARTLFVEKTIDEDGHCIYVFSNFLGQTLLQRRETDGIYHDTYYIYDGYDNLRFVLPPEASSQMSVTGDTWDMDSDESLLQYAYFYRYDQRNRCVEKKLPGCEKILYIYDRRNNLVFSQDGSLRSKNRWRFFLYDDKNRPTVSGTFFSLQAPEAQNIGISSRYDGGPLEGYSSSLSLTDERHIEKVCYYDDYSALSYLSESYASLLSYERSGTVDGYAKAYCIGNNPSGKGKLTVEKVYDTEGGGCTVRSFYYDEQKRIVQQHEISHEGYFDHHFYQYSFTGKTLRHRYEHTTPDDSLTAEYTYTYDHAERLTGTQLSLNGAEPVTIAANTYDELGRLQGVGRMGNPQLLTQYAYNVRSWTTAISSPLFSQQLYYNESHNGSTPQWGGNISAMDWQAAGETQGTSPANGRHRGYTFAYDGLSRLTQADYHEDNQRSNHYDTHYTYDLMGNITALQRSGLHDDGAYSLIDDLTFGYEGNQIIKVTDGVTDGPYRKDAWHYRDRVDADIEREYDGNGNLVKDLDAGILRIEYNSLNLPQMIKFSDHSKHVYAYDATGKKLRAEYHTPIMVVTEPQVPDMGEEMPEQEEVLMEEQQEWNEEEWEEQEEEWTELEHEEEPLPHYLPPLIPQNGEDEPIAVVPNGNEPVIDEVPCEVTTVDYCGDFIYVNGKLKRMLFPGGYVTFRNDSIEHPEYHFYLTDHQGNIRVVANQNGEVEQVNHYYPYGGLMGESTSSDYQPYKYNGKELDRHHGLDWYDYGARWYNGISWMTPDPHAESYYDVTPYGYCHNNPMNKIDPNGKDDFFNSAGAFMYSTPKGSNVYVNNVLITDVPLTNAVHRQAVANVMGYYANKAGVSYYRKGGKPVGNSPIGIVGLKGHRNDSERTLAFTSGNDIYINKKGGKINSTLHDKYNIISTFEHERIHKEGEHGHKENISAKEHASVYARQIGSDTFSKTTKDYQNMVVDSFVEFLKIAITKGATDKNILSLINDANRGLNKTGMQIIYRRTGGDTESYILKVVR